MKTINLFTQKPSSKKSSFKKQIEGNDVKDYILQNINFPLTHKEFLAIDKSFAEIWNHKVGLGGAFYWDEISKEIYRELQSQKLLLEYGRVEKIVFVMLKYIENNGGFLE